MAGRIISKLLKRKKLVIILTPILIVGIILLRNRFFPSVNGLDQARVAKGVVREELILSGEVKADEYAKLIFLSSGELDYIGVSVGEEVEKGKILAKLDTTSLYQTYLQAEADLRRYQASLDKTYDDVKDHDEDESFSQKETRTIAETNRDKAYRAYVIAQKNLDNSVLLAPFDGVIASITHPYEGINTSASESQIEILNPKTIFFEASADQTEVFQIKDGGKVNVVLDSFSEHEYKGEVEYVGLTPKSGEVGSVYQVKVRFTDSESDLSQFKIGMTGDAKLILTEKENVLFVPPEFINSDTNGKYVYLGSKNNKRYLEIGIEGEERVEIKGDIKEGDLVYD